MAKNTDINLEQKSNLKTKNYLKIFTHFIKREKN